MPTQQLSTFPTVHHVKPTKPKLLIHDLCCVTVPPTVSHPNAYWYKDSKKFLNLFATANKHKAMLVLINWSHTSEKVKLIQVTAMDANGITKDKQQILELDAYKQWLETAKTTYTII